MEGLGKVAGVDADAAACFFLFVARAVEIAVPVVDFSVPVAQFVPHHIHLAEDFRPPEALP